MKDQLQTTSQKGEGDRKETSPKGMVIVFLRRILMKNWEVQKNSDGLCTLSLDRMVNLADHTHFDVDD